MSRKLSSVVLALVGAILVSACGFGGSGIVKEYTLTYEAGEGGGVAGPAEQVVEVGEDGEPVTAEPDTGYHFVQWSDGVATAARIDTDVRDELEVTAQFELNEYTLTYNASGGGGIEGPAPQTVGHGEDADTVTAVPGTGYHFVEWSDGLTSAERTDTGVEGDLSVTAVFEINQYTLTYNAGTGGGIAGSASQTVAHGEDAQGVIAVPDTGYSFVQWSDGISSAERSDADLQSNLAVTAEFVLNEYTLSYSAGGGGSLTGETEQSTTHGSDGSTVTAVPDTGYSFVQWSDGLQTPERTDTGVEDDLSVTAQFALMQYSLSYSAGEGGGITGEAEQTVNHGDDGTTVTAVAGAGYTFSQWSDGVITPERTDPGVDGDLNVTAEFVLNEYTLTYSTGAGGSIAGSASQTIPHGNDGATVTAEPDTGYVFDRWSDGLTTAERTDTNIQTDLSVEAEFLPLLSIGGTVSGLSGDGLVLDLNGGEQTLVINSGATTFTFDQPLEDGSSYVVSVSGQPDSDPAQECAVSQASGTINGSDVNGVAVNCEIATYMIRGTISGFDNDDASMELVVNDWEQALTVSWAGTTEFEFPDPVEDGFEYEVSLHLPPDSIMDCTISNRIGTVSGANVEDIHVDCVTVYDIGGEALDLEGHGLELALDVGGQVVEITPDGSYYIPYTFPEPVPDGSSYEVTITTQPVAPEQICSVQNGTGTVSSGGVLDVHVDCGESQLWLESRSGVMAVELQWFGPDTVDILVSSDPDCDWVNIALCADNRSLPGVSGGALELTAVTEGLDADMDWYFVARDGSEYSNQVGARPYPPAFDGAVNTVVADEERVYVGGDFSGMTVPAGRGIVVDGVDGNLVTASLDVEGGGVFVVEPDGRGGWFIGGEFEAVDGLPRNNLARIRPDGSVDPDWESGVAVASGWGTVMAIALGDDKVYVGGIFEDAGGLARQNLAAFDAETGGIDFDWQPALDGEVDDLLIHEGTLFVAGYFDAIDGEPVSNLAALNPDGSLKAGWDAGVDQISSGLAVSGSTLYVGGWFNEANGEPRSHLAAFDVESGNLNADWQPEADGWVWDLVVVGNTVYLGGEFSQAGGGWASVVAAVSADDGTFDDSWDPPSMNGWVHDLTIVGARLYAAGNFDFGFSLPINNVAAFSLSDGSVDENWNPGLDAPASSVAVQYGQVFVGGEFQSAMWKPRSNLAALDADTGVLDNAWAPHVDGQVNALLHAGDAIYTGGSFARINGVLVDRLALLDVGDGTPDTSWSAEIGNGQVNDMALADGRLHVGGSFIANTFIGHGANLAAFDAATGASLSGWGDTPDAPVNVVETAGGQLYAGGRFQLVNGAEQVSLAAFDAASGAFNPGWNPSITSVSTPRVRALEVIGDTLYIGGSFSEVNEETRAGAAALALDDAALQSWDPDDPGTIHVLSAHEGDLYAGGAANDAWRRLMRLDALTGARDSSWDAGVEDLLGQGGITRVNGLAATDNKVYAGGWFTGAQGVKRLRFAVFDTDTGELLW